LLRLLYKYRSCFARNLSELRRPTSFQELCTRINGERLETEISKAV